MIRPMEAHNSRKSLRVVLTGATLRQDGATALPNFFALLQDAPEVLQRTTGVALLLDIANLQAVNVSAGRLAGDAQITMVASVLSRLLPQAGAPDVPRCYRIGGDEFLLFLPDGGDMDAERWLAQINASLRDSYPVALDDPMRVRGVTAPYPGPTGTLAELLDAVYRAVDGVHGAQSSSIVQRLLDRINDTVSLLLEAKRQAFTDVVSGLPNHRAAESALHEALTSPSFRAFSVLLVDGDDLRSYNDLGYEAGNRMIRDLGRMLGERLRDGDVLTRWLSGDEYLIILNGAGRRDACAIAERLRSHVARQTVDWPIPITVSIGVASAPDDGVSVERLIRTVEQRAGVAKRSGKDCVA